MRHAERILLLAVVAATVAIILAGDPLPMYDVSSHLATTVVLDGLVRHDGFWSSVYRIEWIPVPYWLTTALHWPLSKLLGPWLAMRVLVAAFAVALPAGWLFLARRTGGAPQFAPVVALAAFSSYYWSGVTNFLFGLALIAPAYRLFLDLEGLRSRRALALAALLVAAYFAHVFVLASILGACGLAWLLALAARRVPELSDFTPRPAHAAALAATTLLFAAAAWLIFAQPGEGANTGVPVFDLSPRRLGNLFEEPLSSPTIPSAGPALGLFLVVLAAWVLPRLRELLAAPRAELARAVHLPTLVVAAAFAALVYLGPVAILEDHGRVEEDIVPRFAPAAFLFGLAALRLRPARSARLALLVATLAFAGFRLSDAASLHAQQRRTWVEYRDGILARIPERSRILPILAEKGRFAPRSTYFFQFFGNYVVPERHGYSPSLYAQRGQQFLRHLPPGGGPHGEHRDIYDRDITDAEWAFYDFVVIQTGEDEPPIEGLVERADPVASAAGFRLYAVRR
jgi:hypothetical protein